MPVIVDYFRIAVATCASVCGLFGQYASGCFRRCDYEVPSPEPVEGDPESMTGSSDSVIGPGGEIGRTKEGVPIRVMY